MVEATVQKKSEHFPLLTVGGVGAGDAAVLRATPWPPVWSASVVPERRVWAGSWSEFFSTCWMTCILLAISFLVFYGVGMFLVYRHDGFFVVKCNETQSTKTVFYHLIIPHGGKDPLQGNSNYLAAMASKYPRLRIRIYLLIDDSDPNNLSLYERLGGTICAALDSREIDYLRKYPNVNISIMPLSKFMSYTPLKRKWRDIPIKYVPFYARIFSVWLHGGVGLDLSKLGGQDPRSKSSLARVNKNVDALLNLHSNDISAEKYEETLVQLAKEDKADPISTDFLSSIVKRMMNDAMSLLNQSFGFNPFPSDVEPVSTKLSASLVRTNRAKRELVYNDHSPEDILKSDQSNIGPITNTTVDIVKSDQSNTAPITHSPVDIVKSDQSNTGPVTSSTVDIILSNATVLNDTVDNNIKNVYKILPQNDNDKNKNDNEKNMNVESSTAQIDTSIIPDLVNEIENLMNFTDFNKMDKNKSFETEIVFFYDLSFVPEPFHQEASSQLRRHVPRSLENKNKNSPTNYVTIDDEGTFVASNTNMNYFLGYILSTGCKGLPPKYDIQKALMSYCSGQNRNVAYCNGIYIL